MYNELIWQQYIDRVSETGDLLLQAWRLNKLPFYHVSSMETIVRSTFGQQVKTLANINVIDFGCGTGQHLYLLSMIYQEAKCYGVNLHSPYKLPHNNMNYGPNIDLFEGDIGDADVLSKNGFQNTKFQRALCNYTFGHLEYGQDTQFLKTAYECLETDGVFSMWDIAPSTHMGGELYGYKLRPPTEVVEMLKDAGFKRAQFSVMPYAKIAKSFKQVVSKQDTEAFLKETLPILYVATKE